MGYYTKERIRMFISGMIMTPVGAFCLYAGLGFFDGTKYGLVIFWGVVMFIMGVGCFYYVFHESKEMERKRSQELMEIEAKQNSLKAASERNKSQKAQDVKYKSDDALVMLKKLYDKGVLTEDEYNNKIDLLSK